MSGSVLSELAEPLRAAVSAAGGDGEPVRLDRPADAAHGDYASAVALALAKPMKAAPRQIAERIVEQLQSPWIEGAEIAGPGFINLRLQPGWYGHVVERVLDEGARFGAGAAARPQRLQVEFVSGNPTGPVTVGSARNAAYGDSLARLFSFAGPRGRARVLLQRRGPPGRPVRRVAARPRPRRGGAGGRLPGRVRGRDRGPAGARPGRAAGAVDAGRDAS